MRATSRKAILQSVLRGQDAFIEKRLFPCHDYFMTMIRQYRGEADSDGEFEDTYTEDNPKPTEDQLVTQILEEGRNRQRSD